MTSAVAERSDNAVNPRWWDDEAADEGSEICDRVLRYVQTLQDEQHTVHQRFRENAWLYHQTTMMGADGTWREPILARRNGPSATNIIESNIDALVALIARHKPRVAIVTDGASFSLQQRSKWQTRWIEAEFKRTNVYQDVTMVFRDAAVFGTGVLHVYWDKAANRPEVERILIDEIIVDERECRTSAKPRQIHRRKIVDVDVAINMFAKGKSPAAKKKRYAILEAAKARDWTWYLEVPEHHVVLVESWHLPSGPGAGDGRHTICAKGVTLLDEKYEEQDFPFIFYHWSPPLTGFYGRGISDILRAKQARLNRIRRFMTIALDRNARGRMFVLERDAPLKDEIDNSASPIHVIKHREGLQNYKFQTGAGVAPEVYQDYERQKAEASVEVGASSELVAGARLPGVESGAAYRQVSERENGRFSNQAERLELVYIDIADRLMRIQGKHAGDDDRTVMWEDRGNVARQIPWSRVNPENDNYVMSLQAASNLSRSLAGRIQEVIELAQAGAITQAQMLKLLNHPDLQEEMDLATASTLATDMVMEQLEDDETDEFPTPDPLHVANPEVVDRMITRYLVIKTLNAPEHVLQRYRDWITAAQDITGEALPKPAIPGLPAGMVPGPGSAPGPGVPIPGMPIAA